MKNPMAQIGICALCRMRGLLTAKPVVTAADVSSIDGTCSDSLPIMRVCLTCFNTPAGFESENQIHRRLPEAEYKS